MQWADATRPVGAGMPLPQRDALPQKDAPPTDNQVLINAKPILPLVLAELNSYLLPNGAITYVVGGDFVVDAQKFKEQFDEDGYIILRDFIPVELMDNPRLLLNEPTSCTYRRQCIRIVFQIVGITLPPQTGIYAPVT